MKTHTSGTHNASSMGRETSSEQKNFNAKPLSPRRSIALKLSVIARQMRLAFDQYAERSGLTRAKWTLIATVASRPGATQRQIAEALEVREITVGRLIDRLCEEGFLKRQENPTDRRAYCVYLTTAAQPVLDKLDEIARLHEVALFEGFSTEDIERMDASLDALARNIVAEKNLRIAEK